MAYATYTNDRRPWNMPILRGSFREVDFDHIFEYADRGDLYPADFHPEMPHVIFIGPDGETRLAHVKKTVMTMINGEEVVEKWMIKQHREYK